MTEQASNWRLISPNCLRRTEHQFAQHPMFNWITFVVGVPSFYQKELEMQPHAKLKPFLPDCSADKPSHKLFLELQPGQLSTKRVRWTLECHGSIWSLALQHLRCRHKVKVCQRILNYAKWKLTFQIRKCSNVNNKPQIIMQGTNLTRLIWYFPAPF